MTDTQHEAQQTNGRHDGGIHDHAGENGQGSNGANHATDRLSEMQSDAVQKSQRVLQSGIEAATHHARTASDRMTEAMGFSGEGVDKLAEQSKHNREALTHYSTIFTDAIRETSQRWMEIGQKQWQRNLDGLNRIARSKSLHEFSAVHSELSREGMQHAAENCHLLAETSLKAMAQAGNVAK